MSTIILLAAGFVALAGLFLHGAAHSLSNPTIEEGRWEAYAQDSLLELGKAALFGAAVVILALPFLA